MDISKLRSLILAAVLALPGAPALADTLAIIVHPSMQNELSADDVRRIYLGKSSQLPNGDAVTPLIVRQPDPAHTEFAQQFLQRSPRQLNTYWAKRLFTGKSRPPVPVQSLREMKAKVAGNKAFIGYVRLSDADPSVRTVVFSTPSS